MRLSPQFSWARAAAIVGAVPFVLTACGGPPAEQVRSAVVVRAADATLTGGPLERWLVRAPNPPTARGALALAARWIDQALLITAMQKGPAFDDSASVDAVILPDAERGMSLEFWRARDAARPPVTAAEIDSLATLDRVRVFQRVFLTLPAKPDSATLVAALQRARALLKRAQAGGQTAATFAVLAREASPDSMTRASGGFLPAMTRNEVPPSIAGVVWALHPGDVGPIMRMAPASGAGPSGFAILRRATKAESQAGLKLWLAPQLARRADSLFVDSLTRARHLKVASDGLARLRTIAREPVVADAGPPLATWDGGGLAPATARKWLMMIPALNRGLMAIASDSIANAYLRELSQREMVLALAAPGGAPSAKARAALAPELRKSYTIIEGELRRIGGTLSPGEATTAFFDSTLAGSSQFRELPGALAAVLRQRYPVSIDYKAIDAVVKLASVEWNLRQGSDSAHGPQTKRP